MCLYTLGKSIIDNLVIESVEKNSFPDKSKCEKVISSEAIKEGISIYKVEKEKLGLEKIGKVEPFLQVLGSEEWAKQIGLNYSAIHPRLNKSNNVAWYKDRIKKSKNWSFEKTSEIEEIHLIRGVLAVMTSRGVNNSNCIGVKPSSVYEIDISEFALPIKITYSFDCVLPPGVTGKGVVIAKGNYRPKQNILNFSSLQTSKMVDVSEGAKKNKNDNAKDGYIGEWNTRTVYVSEDGVDLWFNGKRSGVLLGSSIDNKKIYIYELDQSLIDNLIITSVEPESVPEFSLFKKYAETIPFEKGGRSYPIDKAKLNLDSNSPAILGVYDKAAMVNALGLD